MNHNKVYLVGAGPGDADLITVKGVEALKKADIILYDRLVDKSVLDYRKKNCELIYVGKDVTRHMIPQEDINKLLVEKYMEGKSIVRLKGGDPYVFGRGGEEAEALYDNNIDFEVIPGISSSIGGLEYAGIPVTHRDYASSFQVITGHRKKGESLDINYGEMLDESKTLVFLMGISNIKEIAENLISAGKSPETPVAFVENACRKNQRTVTSKLKEAYKTVSLENIKPPALFVVGNVVKLHKKLGFYERLPLFGKKIVITRTRKQSSILKRKLESEGAHIYEIPTIDIVPNEVDCGNFVSILNRKPDYIVFTSVNAVEIFFDNLYKADLDARILYSSRIASIGSATTSRLREYGIIADIQPEEYYNKELLEEIKSDIDFCKKNYEDVYAFIPCSNLASDTVAEGLSNIGCKVEKLSIYNNVVYRSSAEKLKDILKKQKIDYITFTSSSTFRNAVYMLEEDVDLLKNTKLISIGKITEAAIKEMGFENFHTATLPSIDAMVELIISLEKKEI